MVVVAALDCVQAAGLAGAHHVDELQLTRLTGAAAQGRVKGSGSGSAQDSVRREVGFGLGLRLGLRLRLMVGARLDSRSLAELTGTLICTGSSRSFTTSFWPSWYKEKETVPPACDVRVRVYG